MAVKTYTVRTTQTCRECGRPIRPGDCARRDVVNLKPVGQPYHAAGCPRPFTVGHGVDSLGRD